MKHILLVDDNLTNLKQAGALLKEQYKVSVAKSGEQALEFLEKFTPDLILMDVEMPEMNGYETTKRIKAMPSAYRVPIIFLTGDQDVESEIRGFECGAVDYVRKPFVREIMLHRVALHLELYEYQQSLESVLEARTNELMETMVQTERMKAELDLAGRLQQHMLPKDFPQRDEFLLYAKMMPAKETCGDIYDFCMYEDRYLVTSIGDASGKGIGAALFMTQAKAILTNVILDVFEEGIDLGTAMQRFNNQLCTGNMEDLFLTMFVSILDIETGELTYCNAAHNPPLIKGEDGTFDYLQCEANFIVGGVANMEFQCGKLNLTPGTKLFLYTDGVTESQNMQGDLYGEERLRDAVNYALEEEYGIYDTLDYVLKDIQSFDEGNEQSDDITVLLLRYDGR